jgi:predicted Zn-dependent protease
MSQKSPRRSKLEEGLSRDPGDVFLRYALAMECLKEGELNEGRGRLRALIVDHPDDQIAAYQQLGQSFLESGEEDEARAVLTEGINRAMARGDSHAAAEMRGLLDQLA